jgi:hypothetical protein
MPEDNGSFRRHEVRPVLKFHRRHLTTVVQSKDLLGKPPAIGFISDDKTEKTKNSDK